LNFGAKKEDVGGVTWSKITFKAQFPLRPNTWPKENPILLGPKYKAQKLNSNLIF